VQGSQLQHSFTSSYKIARISGTQFRSNISAFRWKTRKRQRRGLLGNSVGRSSAEFSSVMGVVAPGESRQCGHRRFVHPGSASGSPEGLIYNVERGKAGEQVGGRPAGSEQECSGTVHAEHHQHRWCGFEVGYLSCFCFFSPPSLLSLRSSERSYMGRGLRASSRKAVCT